MSVHDQLPVRGRVDAAGRLAQADPELAALHARAGGEEGGALAIPQVAALARLARRLGIVISRSVVAADGDMDLDLWIRAQPSGNDVELAISGWKLRDPHGPASAGDAEREADFLRASADWTWQTDASLRFTALSPGAAAAIGKTPADLIGKQITRLFRLQEGSDGALAILGALAEQRRFDNQPAELRGRKKQLYTLSGVPMIDGAGQFAGFRGSATSLPAHSAVEPPASSQDSEREVRDNGAFGERLDKALRGPLDHIITNAETISAQPEGPLRRDYAGYARDIAAAGRHLLELVDDLVDLHAIERSDFTPDAEALDLADLARRTAGLLSVRAAGRKVRISAPANSESVPATGEFKRVLQIAMNLVSNAIRYAPEQSVVLVRVERDGGRALLSVADEGKGIAPADQARIFEKFERVDPTEAGGTGLGLYIARRLARAMGGDIVVSSAPGKGANFILSLPAPQ